jgi:hypothetical protein
MRENYDISGTIAMFIASALQHPNPPCNGVKRRMSTIKVDQYKNKFNNVVVYCDLAHPDLVSESWWEDGHQGNVSDEYFVKCIDHDATKYRSAYRKMLFLLPEEYHAQTLAWASYDYLLIPTTSELDAFMNDDVNQLYVSNLLKTWRATDVDVLKNRFHKIYDRS